MKHLALASLGLAVCAFAPTTLAEPPAGFTNLFNEKNLDGWHGHNPHDTVGKVKPDQLQGKIDGFQEAFNKHWSVENGEMVNDGHGPYATTNKSYGDVEFHVDYKTVAQADSGVYMRGTPQVQIWDTTEAGGKWHIQADLGSSGLWNNSPGAPGKNPLVHADKPFGEWNKLCVVQLGARTTIHFNDKLTVDNAIMENYYNRKAPLAAKGPIHLQTHGGEIRWKNIHIREIPAEEANKRLRGNDSVQGFTSIFNGKNLDGWQGAIDNYQVKDGAIVCKEGHGGNLFTKEEYGDFVVRVEFKLPPGGNNGLAIRYPGKGNPAFDGMTELQVLDDTADKYKDLDLRQYHGSVYGQVPVHRGYLRPVGQWNYQEVTVIGSTIKVELNGSVILNADINKVTEFMDGGEEKFPGRKLKKGYFGFAGHNDPVMFRNIAIKRLN